MKKEKSWKIRRQKLYDNRSGNRKGKRITVISAYSNQTKQLIALTPSAFDLGQILLKISITVGFEALIFLINCRPL